MEPGVTIGEHPRARALVLIKTTSRNRLSATEAALGSLRARGRRIQWHAISRRRQLKRLKVVKVVDFCIAGRSRAPVVSVIRNSGRCLAASLGLGHTR